MSLRVRLPRILLLLAFLAGGGGIPALDGLVYHRGNPAESPQGVHLEAPGVVCHTDTCLTALPILPGTEGAQPVAVRPAGPGTSEREPDEDRVSPTLAAARGSGLPRSPPLS
jgi:hypothetical protein